MAKNKDNFPDEGLGDDEFDFGAFEDGLDDINDPSYTGNEDKPKSSRSAVSGLSPKSVLKSAVSVQTVGNLADKIGDEFHSVGRAHSASIDILSDLNRYKQDVLKDIAPTINSLKRAGRLYAPKVKGMLPAKLYDKLNKVLAENEEYSQASEEEARNASIGAQLSDIFSAQQEISKEQYIKDKSDEMVKTAVEGGRHKESVTVLSQIRNIVKANQLFFDGVFKKYLMKSLELKFRHLFYTKDILDITRSNNLIVANKLDAIKHNTSLPDMMKRQMMESLGQTMKDRLYGKVATPIGEWADKFKDNLMKNVKENLFEQISAGFNDMLAPIADAAITNEEMNEMTRGMGGRVDTMPTSIMSMLVRKLLVDTGAISLKAGLGMQKFKDMDSMAEHFMEELPYMINDYAQNMPGRLGDFARMVVPTLDKERGGIENTFKNKGTEEIPFDVITRRSIVEIIPGFLSKIHQESSSIAKMIRYQAKKSINKLDHKAFDSQTSSEELIFDKETQDFISVSEFQKSTMKEFFGTKTSRTENVQGAVDQLFAAYKRREGDEDTFKQYLPSIIKLINNLAKHGETISPKRILKYLNGDELSEIEETYLDDIFKGIPEEDMSELGAILEKTLFRDSAESDSGIVEDKDLTKDLSKIIRKIGVENDKFVKKLSSLNVYGGQRHLSGIISTGSEVNIKSRVNELKNKYIRKYGPTFEKDPKLKKRFEEDVKELKKFKGVNHGQIMDIQNDVDYDTISDRMGARSDAINTEADKREEGRIATDGSTASERMKEALKSELEKDFRPALDFIYKMAPFLKSGKIGSSSNSESESDVNLGDLAGGAANRETIDNISNETGTPNRDSAQISGPGLYWQGVDKELHVPLTQNNEIKTNYDELFGKSLNKNDKSLFSKFINGSLASEINTRIELLREQMTLTESMHTQILNKSDKVIASLLGVTESVTGQVKTVMDTVTKSATEYYADVKKKVKGSFIGQGLSNKTNREMMLGYLLSEGKELTDEQINNLKDTELYSYFKKKSESVTDLAKSVGGKINKNIDFVSSGMSNKTNREMMLGFILAGGKELTDVQLDSLKGTSLYKAIKKKSDSVGGMNIFSSDTTIREALKDPKAREKITNELLATIGSAVGDTKEYSKDKLNQLKETALYSLLIKQLQGAKESAQGISKSATDTFDSFATNTQGFFGRVASKFKKKDPLPSILHAIVNIETMLAKQFDMTSEIEATKIHIANQQLMATNRSEVIASGDRTSIGQLPLWARAVKLPFTATAKLAKFGGKGVATYFRAMGSFYNGLWNTSKRIVPLAVKGALGAGKLALKGAKALVDPAIGLAKGIFNASMNVNRFMYNAAKGTVKGAVGLFKAGDRYADVYRKDEVKLGSPLIKGKDVKAGKYTYPDGKTVTDCTKIDRPVFGSDKQLVITADDLEHGLVNGDNKPLSKRSLAGKAAGLALDAIKGAGKLAWKGIKMAGSLTKSTIKFTGDVVLGALKMIPGVGSMIRNGKDWIRNVAIGKTDLKEAVTSHLIELISLVKDIKGSVVSGGIREGSYADHLRDRAAERSNKLGNRASDARKAKLSGMKAAGLGAAASMLPGGGGIMDTIGQMAMLYGGGKLLSLGKSGLTAVKGALGFGGAAEAAAGGVAAKTGIKAMAKRAITGTAGRLIGGTALRTAGAALATGLAGVASAPVLIGAAAVAGTAAAGYGLYVWRKNKNRRRTITEIRNQGYRVPSDSLDNLIDLEDTVYEAVKDAKGGPVTIGKLSKYIKSFGLDPDNHEHYVFFKLWYDKVFFPIFQSSVKILRSNFNLEFDDQNKLTDDQIEEYRGLVDTSDEVAVNEGIGVEFSADGFKEWQLTDTSEEAKESRKREKETKKKSFASRTMNFAKGLIGMETDEKKEARVVKETEEKVAANKQATENLVSGKPSAAETKAGTTSVSGAAVPLSGASLTKKTKVAMCGGKADANLARFDDIFNAAGKQYGVDPGLLKAFAKAESCGNPQATNPSGARGLMQLMPGTASELGVTDPFDPTQAIHGGAKYIAQNIKKFSGDHLIAAAGYNWGPNRKILKNAVGTGGVDSIMDKLPEETQGYVTKIDTYYKAFKGQQGAADTSNIASAEKTAVGTEAIAKVAEPTGSVAAITPVQPNIPAQSAIPAPSAQPDITSQVASSKAAAKNDIVASDTQTKLLSEQNGILNQIAGILTSISKSSGLGEDGSKLLAGKLDSLISAVSNTNSTAIGTGNTKVASNEIVPHVGTVRNLSPNKSGINVSRSLAYAS